MKKIITHQAKIVLVDDEDYILLSKWRWSAVKKNGGWYARRCQVIKNKQYAITMHRQLMKLKYGNKLVVHHIDGNGLNNQRKNLLITTNRLNVANKKKNKGIHYSIYKGVTFDKKKNKWVVNMFSTKKGKRKCHFLGYFTDEKE